MTKLIPRYQNPSSPLVMRGDNSRVLIPINLKQKYKALTWKERVQRTFPEQPVIRSDNRSSYQKALDRRTGIGVQNIQKDKKAASQLMTAIDYTMPSHLIQGVANAVTNSDAENHGIFGENGILFQGDSPFTVAGNLATDFVVAPWAVSKFKLMSRKAVPEKVSSFADVSSVSSGIPDKEATVRGIEQAKRDTREYYHSDEFKQRVLNSGQFTKQEYEQLLDEIDKNLNSSTFKIVDDFPGEFGKSGDSFRFPDGRLEMRIKKADEDRAYATTLHEYGGHQSTGNITPGRIMWGDDNFPMITRMLQYDASIQPKIQVHPRIANKVTSKEISYMSKPQEVRARAFTTKIGMKKFPNKFISSDALSLGLKELDLYFNKTGLDNYLSKFLIGTPIIYKANE